MKLIRTIHLAAFSIILNVMTAQSFTSDLTITDGSPHIHFRDTSGGHEDYWIHVNNERMYFLLDENDDGSWTGESPWPLVLHKRKSYFADDALVINGDTRQVGIGTTAPDATLVLNKPNQDTTMLKIVSSNDNDDEGRDISIHSLHPSISFLDTSNNGNWGALTYNTNSFNLAKLNSFGNADLKFTFNTESGNMGIGTTTPDYRLDVNGTIRAREVIVESGWSDYVFEEDYILAPLSEVEAHIKEKGHLPGIPPAAEIEANGAKLSELVTLQMAKIEELTLHLIEKEKQLAQEQRLNEKQSEELRAIREDYQTKMDAVFTRLNRIESEG